MRLKIVVPEKVLPGRLDGTAQVFLDGRELKHVCEVKVNLSAGEANRACIVFYPTEVIVDGDFEEIEEVEIGDEK